MKPWLPHPSFPTPAGRVWYRGRWARQHHLPCTWNLFCCLMLSFSGKQQLPSSEHNTQGHKASCRLTQPWKPPSALENLQEKAAVGYGVLEGSRVVIGAHSNCQAVGRKGREAACRPRKLELFQQCCQLCCKILLLAGALHNLMGLGIFVPPFKGNNRCLPWL